MNLFKKYISIAIMLILLLTPSVIQLVHVLGDEHHHEAVVYSSEKDQHFQEYEAECEICTFQFNSFTVEELPFFDFQQIENLIFFSNLYNSFKGYFSLSSFLRGPPLA